MKKMDENEITDFLTEGTRTGKLATVREDGRPHVAPIWFVWNEGKIILSWFKSFKIQIISGFNFSSTN